MSDRTQTCPICSRNNIEEQQNKCPQCNSDLSCFKVLDSIPDEQAVDHKMPEGFVDIPEKIDCLMLEVQRIPKAFAESRDPTESASRSRNESLPCNIPYFRILSSLSILCVFFVLCFAFYRINILEKNLRVHLVNASEEIRQKDADILKLNEKYSLLDKKMSINFLKQELKFNELLDKKTEQIVTRINALAEKNRKAQDKIQSALSKSAGMLTAKQKGFSKKIKEYLKQKIDRSNKKVENISAEIIALLNEIAKSRQVSDNSLNQKIEEQRTEVSELLKKLEKTLKENAEKKKDVLSLFTIDIF